MKLSAHITLIALVSIATMQAASAQEGRGMRFNYAPNVWKAETARLPKGYGDFNEPKHNVQSGSVPTRNVLGLDPMMLSKPAPAPVVAANPVTTSLTPKLMAPTATPSFNPLFGKPVTPIMAQAAPLPPAVPQQAVAQPAMAKPAATSAPAVRRTVNTGLSGRIMPHRVKNVAPMMATPAVASYGGMGYVPGAYLPSSGSGGGSASTKVSGVLMTRVRHH